MIEDKFTERIDLHKKSHETLIKLLNNIGIVGAILAAIVDIILVIVFVFGMEFEQDATSTAVYAITNAFVGVMINILLRYQGQKYAEVENEELRSKFYREKIKRNAKHLTLLQYNIVGGVIDVFMKGASAAFSVAGYVYLAIKGSHNYVQILITLATLILFGCFGLISMNKSYCRYYDIQIPYMELYISRQEVENNGIDKRRESISDGVRTDCTSNEETRRTEDNK